MVASEHRSERSARGRVAASRRIRLDAGKARRAGRVLQQRQANRRLSAEIELRSAFTSEHCGSVTAAGNPSSGPRSGPITAVTSFVSRLPSARVSQSGSIVATEALAWISAPREVSSRCTYVLALDPSGAMRRSRSSRTRRLIWDERPVDCSCSAR